MQISSFFSALYIKLYWSVCSRRSDVPDTQHEAVPTPPLVPSCRCAANKPGFLGLLNNPYAKYGEEVVCYSDTFVMLSISVLAVIRVCPRPAVIRRNVYDKCSVRE